MPRYIPDNKRQFLTPANKKRVNALMFLADDQCMSMSEAKRLVSIVKKTKGPVTECQELLKQKLKRLGLA